MRTPRTTDPSSWPKSIEIIETSQPRCASAVATTVCCSSAPPITGMSEAPAMSGQVMGATKHTRGRRPSARAGAAAASGSGRSSGGVGAKVVFIDVLEAAGGALDGGVLAHPALLLGGDRDALAARRDDRARQLLGRAAGDHLRGAWEDQPDVGILGAHHGHAEHHAFEHH